jgi:hypothetical protein
MGELTACSCWEERPGRVGAVDYSRTEYRARG